MRRIHSKNTRPELKLRRYLWAEGLRYRVHYGPERIDIAFPKKKVAIFVDGCFWHGCPTHSHFPKSNIDYWVPKLKRNIERDRKITFELKVKGWTVFRLWEHQLGNLECVTAQIRSAFCQN